MNNLLIKNVDAVLKDRIDQSVDVLIKDGKIAEIGKLNPENCEIIDGSNMLLFPGFVDIHIHGGGNSDFMDATPTAFENTVKSHLMHGTTTIVPTAMSASFEDICGFLSAYKTFKKISEYADMVPGLHLEGPYFSGANAKSSGAQPKNILRFPDIKEISKILKFADGSIIRWDAAPELPGSAMFAKIMKDNGILCAVGHSDATASEAENGFKNGFSHITHFLNATSAHRKREQKVFAGILEATYLNDDITIELIGDGCHIAKEDFLLALKIKGAEKISVITDAMRLSATNIKQGKLGSILNGTDCIVDDGVAKLTDMSSFAGSICTMDRALKVLCNDFSISPCIASVMMSLSPSKLLKIQDKKGTISVGKDADLVLTDKSFNIKNVILAGVPQIK